MKKNLILDNTYHNRKYSYAPIYGKYCLWLTIRNPLKFIKFGLDIHFERPTIVINILVFELRFYRERFYKKTCDENRRFI